MPNSIIEEKFETAKEFLAALRVINQRWISASNKWESSWLFRGQANAYWHLIPSAWRTTSLERFKRKYRDRFTSIYLEPFEKILADIKAQVKTGEITAVQAEETIKYRTERINWVLERDLQYFAEMQAIKEFTEFADRLGHPVPGANEFLNLSHGYRNYGDLPEEEYLISKFVNWSMHSNPFNVDCSAVALAQHHGVPTRLLDWTENPLIAAFFAAEELTQESFSEETVLDNDRIAVWAISKEIFSSKEYDSEIPSPIQLIARPRHEIGYLLAQKSVFTHDKMANERYLETGKWRSVEEAINHNSDYLKKLALPVKEVGELLRLLWLEGISRAHLMPTYDNVTRALETKAWWENK